MSEQTIIAPAEHVQSIMDYRQARIKEWHHTKERLQRERQETEDQWRLRLDPLIFVLSACKGLGSALRIRPLEIQLVEENDTWEPRVTQWPSVEPLEADRQIDYKVEVRLEHKEGPIATRSAYLFAPAKGVFLKDNRRDQRMYAHPADLVDLLHRVISDMLRPREGDANE